MILIISLSVSFWRAVGFKREYCGLFSAVLALRALSRPEESAVTPLIMRNREPSVKMPMRIPGGAFCKNFSICL